MNDPLVFEVALSLPFQDTMEVLERVLKEEGFGVVTHVDARATFKEKLGLDFRPFSILGVCNPHLAYRLLTAEPATGLMLPCKITVEEAEAGKSIVRLINPEVLVMLELGNDPDISRVAQKANQSFQRVVKTLDAL